MTYRHKNPDFPMLQAKVLGVLLLLGGCGPFHARQVQEGNSEKKLTLGAVQRTVSKGMSGGEVIESLGSPNIVSTDEHGFEVWVYDKFATDVVASEWGWSVFGAVLGAGSDRQCSATRPVATAGAGERPVQPARH